MRDLELSGYPLNLISKVRGENNVFTLLISDTTTGKFSLVPQEGNFGVVNMLEVVEGTTGKLLGYVFSTKKDVTYSPYHLLARRPLTSKTDPDVCVHEYQGLNLIETKGGEVLILPADVKTKITEDLNN